jgi:hypothetical protein
MLRYVSDEDFSYPIVRGLRRRQPGLDVVRVQEVSLSGADDPTVLAWAAGEGRIVLSHDTRTMSGHAFDRILAGEPMPGLFLVPQTMLIRQAIDELEVLALCSFDDEWDGRVLRLPL